MLTLAEVEEGHDGGFLVLWRVAFQDFSDEALILSCEFEGDGKVVVGGISVLKVAVSHVDWQLFGRYIRLKELRWRREE